MPPEDSTASTVISGRFSTTRWSTVAIASDPASPDAHAALERLCQDYWPPLFAFALRKSRNPHTAEDITQAFFARFIERGYLNAADRTRGRFRTFLLTCFEHFLIHDWERNRAAKRGGHFTLLSWDEHRGALESRSAATESPPERHYDREWALVIMERALARLQEDFAASGRERNFQVLGRFLSAEAAPGEYAAAGEQLGLADRAVKLVVHRMRRRYGRLMRDAVRETVADESDVQDELRYLVELLSE